MTDYVFIGPSLEPDEVGELLPGAVVLPPIRHGDLLRIAPAAGDRVLIVDGLFMQTAPVRHREILAALADGAVVAGSSSMGALRAAELCTFGMRGVGSIFELYRDGVITGDDEVAVLYGPAEDGYPLLSRPLVDIRLSLSAAVAAGVVTDAEAAGLLELARSTPFPRRGFTALRRIAPAGSEQYLDWSAQHPVDVKGDDARRLLRAATDGTLLPAGPDDAPIRNVCTYPFERWRARHRGADLAGRFVSETDVVSVLMALHPDFPALHRRDVLRALTGVEREDAAVALAVERGLLHAGELDPELAGWLAPSEQDLAGTEAALRIMVRTLGAVSAGPRSARCLPAELSDPETLDVARRFARKAMSVNDRLPRPDSRRPERRLFFRPDAIDGAMAQAWGCPREELTARARDRGFVDLVRLRAVVEPLVGLLTLGGAPDFGTTVLASPDYVAAGR